MTRLRLTFHFLTALALACASNSTLLAADDGPHAGPLLDHFELTLSPGERTEAVGPLWYSQHIETQHTWALPPLFSHTADPATESEEYDFLYPVLTGDRYGQQYRWQLFQLLSFGGGPTQTESSRDRFTLFPIYFQQRSSDPAENYTALFPCYGHLKNRLFRDEIFFVMFPCYSQTRKKDVVTDNYVYPVFHLRHGEQLRGWQFWPLVGHEHKNVTSQTNGFGDVEMIPGHDTRFVLWPFYFNAVHGIGTTNLEHQAGVIPFYTQMRSPLRDSTTVLWPFFSRVDDRGKQYREWDLPWPLVVFADGEGKTTRRVWPFFSQAHSKTLKSSFYLWPVYTHREIHSAPLDRRRTRIVFFLFSDTKDRNTETDQVKRRVDLWPLFTHRHEMNGNTRLQVLAPLEPFLPENRSIERDYSPLWSLWRAERNPQTGAASQSLLWNLYRRQKGPEAKKYSLLFGLFQYESCPAGATVRVFYVPWKHAHPAAEG